MIPNCKRNILSDLYTDKTLEHNILFEGTIYVPSRTSGTNIVINVNDDMANYDYLLVERSWGAVSNMQPIMHDKVNGLDVCKFQHITVSDWGAENANIYSLWLQRGGVNKISASFNGVATIQTDGNVKTDMNYTEQPITKIIGIKLIERTYTDRVLASTLLDFFYPIGIYIETSDTNFDPNIAWGGTWVRDTIGLVTVGAYKDGEEVPTTETAVKTGEKTGKLFHYLRALIGAFNGDTASLAYVPTARARDIEHKYGISGINPQVDISASNVNHSTMVVDHEGKNEVTTTQPSIGVIRWHRIE